jgi:L-ascorbate 6-phosphate lactonase
MNIKWIGQSGYILAADGIKLVIDPYLSNSIEEQQGLKRMFPVPVAIEDLQPDYIYCTHNHLDHFDPQTILKILEVYPLCKIIGPTSVIEHATRLKISSRNMILLNQYEHLSLGKLKLTATPAFHSDPFSTGLLIKDEQHTVYFSGDTEYVPELAGLITKMSGTKPDLFFVCINGKLGNMNAEDAARLALALNPEIVVPNHYGMFAENTADPLHFTALCTSAGLKSKIMRINTSIKL